MKTATFAPAYCAIYPRLAEVARKHGYALAIHGSMSRDFDLICIPWTENPSAPRDVVDEMSQVYALKLGTMGYPVKKNHGRIAYTLILAHESFIDLSFMPRAWGPERKAELEKFCEQYQKAHIAAQNSEAELAEERAFHGECPGGCGYWKEAAKMREAERDEARARVERLENDLEVRTQRVVDLESEIQDVAEGLSVIKTMRDMDNVSLQRVHIMVRRLRAALAECGEG